MLSSKCKAKLTSTFFLASRCASVKGNRHAIPCIFGLVVTTSVHPQLSGRRSPVPTSQGPAALAGGCARPEQDQRQQGYRTRRRRDGNRRLDRPHGVVLR